MHMHKSLVCLSIRGSGITHTYSVFLFVCLLLFGGEEGCFFLL